MDYRKKYVLVILDGAGDTYRNEHGQSPLAMADIPFIDKIARNGICGKMQTLFSDLPKESLVAQLGMLGWNPYKYYPHGRASAELLASKGTDLCEEDVAFRANFVSLQSDKLISYNAKYITSEKAMVLVDRINSELLFEFPDFELCHNSDFRNTLVIKNAQVRPAQVLCLEPHENIGRRLNLDQLVTSVNDENVGFARYVNEYLCRVRNILVGEDANALIPWSPSSAFRLPAFNVNTGFKGKTSIVGAMDFLKGIAMAGNVDFFKVGTGKPKTDFEGKGRCVVDLLMRGYNMVICHINAPDEASHMQSLDLKIETLENIDRHIVQPVYEYFRNNLSELGGVMVVPDHYTNVFCRSSDGKRISSHSIDPVPFALWNNEDVDAVSAFTEDDASNGIYGKTPIASLSLITLLTNNKTFKICEHAI